MQSASIALSLLRRFEAQHGLNLPGLDTLAHRLRTMDLAPRMAAFRQGEPCRHVFVVRSGLLKQVFTTPDGAQWIKSFTGEGDLFACPHAIAGRAPTGFASVAIEASVVERIDFREIEAMGDSSVEWQKAIRFAFQRLAELKVERERDLLSASARELYCQLVDAAPPWLARVPQKDLAAYLGVTPVGLNRIIRGKRTTTPSAPATLR